jgi:ATP-dependent helicase/nuclease subunit A
LVIPLFWGKRKGFFKMLESHLPDWGQMTPGGRINGQLIVGGGALDLEAGEKPPLRLELGEDLDDKETPLQRRTLWMKTMEQIREKASRGLPLYTPSASASDSSPFFWDEITDPGSGPVGGGKAFGLAFHEVMEHIDLTNGSNVKNLSQMRAAGQSIPEAAETLANLCLKTIGHPLMDRVRLAQRFFREVPFSVTDEEKIIEGKIDLFFEEPDGWVIIDYKTDDVHGEPLEKRFNSYREQGRWYARAVKKATGSVVKEVLFFFIRSGELRSLTDFG